MSGDKVLELLRKLDELRRAGLISEEEYSEKVKRLLESQVMPSQPHPSTALPAPGGVKAGGTRVWRYVGYTLAAILLVVIIAAVAFSYYHSVSQASGGGVVILPQPDIRVTKVYAESYLAGLDVRARVEAVLYNYGDADGYAVVKLYTTWDTTRDEATTSAFVPVGTSVTVEADLDVPAFRSWSYGAEVVSQRMA